MSRPAEQLFVSLQDSSSSSSAANTYASKPPGGFYVIVGCGIAAWYNHLCLLKSEYGRKRLGGLPVIHIGYEEPWSRRQHERMGQWPHMLDYFRDFGAHLGLHDSLLTQADWLSSSDFSSHLKKIRSHIESHYRTVTIGNGPDWGHEVNSRRDAPEARPLEFMPGFVGVIEKKATMGADLPAPEVERRRNAKVGSSKPGWHAPDRWEVDQCEFRLSVYHRGFLTFVYAHKIDLCSGLGYGMMLPESNFATPALRKEYLPTFDEPPSQEPRRIMTGNEFIGSRLAADATVLINGGSPVGAQSVQFALDQPAARNMVRRAFWMAYKAFDHALAANVPGGRNLLEIKGALTDGAKDRLHRIAWYDIKKIRAGGGKKLICDLEMKGNEPEARKTAAAVLQAVPDTPTREEINRAWLPRADLSGLPAHNELIASVEVDQIVHCSGQEVSDKAEGCVAYMVAPLKGTFEILVRSVIPGEVPLGLTNSTMAKDADTGDVGCIRLLGAANWSQPGLSDQVERNGYKEPFEDWWKKTLPLEGPAGGGGLMANLPRIRRANQYKPAVLDLNSAFIDELEALFGPGAARKIVTKRCAGGVAAWTVELRDLHAKDPLTDPDMVKSRGFLSVPQVIEFLKAQGEGAAANTIETNVDKFRV